MRTITYEAKTCGRCGGSGNYSYCTMHGTRCFGCGGSGKTTSKAGIAARASVKAWMLEAWGRAVENVTVGERIFIESDNRYRLVAGVEAGGSGSSTVDGVKTEHTYTMISYKVRKYAGSDELVDHGYGFVTGTRVIVKPTTSAQWDALFTFASTLKGATITSKPA